MVGEASIRIVEIKSAAPVKNVSVKLELGEQIWYAASCMNRLAAALRLLGVGWYVGVCIVLGVWGGLWLDDRLNTQPIFVIVGLILGVVIAFYGLYRMVLPNLNKKQNKGKD